MKKIKKSPLFLPISCFLLVLLFSFFRTPDFFSISIRHGILYGYLVDILNRSSELIILAVGMTFVVAASAGTDISVGAVMALSGAVCCVILGGGVTYRVPYGVGFLCALLTGALCGLWNGFLVAKMKIQPMVATLILFTAGRGMAQLLTGGTLLYMRKPNFQYLGSHFPHIPIPTPILVSILVIIATELLIKKTALGLYIQAVGMNEKASWLIGIPTIGILLFSYVFCGLCAGLAGMMETSRIYSVDANNIGLNKELDAILAVALGGNHLEGGRFSLMGSVIGAMTIQTLSTSLYAIGVSADQLPVYKAIAVVIIVVVQSPWLQKKRMIWKQKREKVAA